MTTENPREATARATPLVELLRRVPTDAVMNYEHSPTHSEHIPVGRLCHEAADALEAEPAAQGPPAPTFTPEKIERIVAEMEEQDAARGTTRWPPSMPDWIHDLRAVAAAMKEGGK